MDRDALIDLAVDIIPEEFKNKEVIKVDLDGKELDEKCSSTCCSGFRHCKSRTCSPANKDCRECIDDASKAIEEEQERR